MTWFRWWHKHVRLHFRPRSEESAIFWKRRLSLLYAFFGWNAFGLILYNFVSKKKITLSEEDKLNLSPGQQLAKEMGKDQIEVISIKGFKVKKLSPPDNERHEKEIITQ